MGLHGLESFDVTRRIQSNPTIYCDVQFSHIQRSRQELELELTHSKYTKVFLLSLRKAVFLH